MNSTDTGVPTWRLREQLRRRATERIEGRASFERSYWKSDKPLQPIELDPRQVIQLLDYIDKVEQMGTGKRPEPE